jgi:type 1 glutamine amidotransferase
VNAEQQALRICLVSGSFEYKSDESLGPFKDYLEDRYPAEVTLVSSRGDWENLPGLEALDHCDVALFFTRRLRITGDQLERIKKYCLSGRPIVAMRTASHGFQGFLEFDKEVLGGNYHNHYGNEITQKVSVVPEVEDHPILEGITGFASKYSLYRTSPLAPDCTVLMTAEIPGMPPEPSVWTRTHNGGRVVYIGLGGLEDFENDTFKRLVANSLFWAAGYKAEAKPLPPASLDRKKPAGILHLNLRRRIQDG